MQKTEAIFLTLIFMILIGLIPVWILGANNKRKTSVVVQNISLIILSLISMFADYQIIQYMIIVWWIFLFFYSSGGREKSLWVKED